MQQRFETDPLVAPLPQSPAVRRMAVCSQAGCTVLLATPDRICRGCYAEAASQLAWKFETELIDGGFAPGSDDLRAALAGHAWKPAQDWYQTGSPLGTLSLGEALALRELTDAACYLVARGGVAALAELPAARRPRRPLIPELGTFHLGALPGRIDCTQTDPSLPLTSRQWTRMAISVLGAFAVLAAWACR